MRSKDIEIGKYYRLKNSPEYGYIKIISILNPREGENTNNFIVVKCEHTVMKGDLFGFIRYFKPCNIIREWKNAFIAKLRIGKDVKSYSNFKIR